MSWVRHVIERMLNEIYLNCDCTEKVLDRLDAQIPEITQDPSAIENTYAVNVAGVMLLEMVQKKYGGSSLNPEVMSVFPAFSDVPRSQVNVNMITPEHPVARHTIFLGCHINTWHQFFYELAHESIHMLGPVNTNEVEVATLDEGVAVKFAEDFYREYIFPLTGVQVPQSPVNASQSVYFKAYQAANKIPDTVLFEIRKEFNNFREVKNPLFYEMTQSYLSRSESELLCSAFDYKAY
ncbi:hypothetical protein [Pseudomonas asplenii]|uniref:hypothetical protein n=1 Tax=Pseudomonas asplenii TaxID=53407 RepID=UPI0006B4A353|nr:hypothetical protein [Pseudomonas fuscovaginae]KPA98206.1 hypothetical protein PF70_01602 [Pseudomonas fuscovaginae]